MSVEKLYTVADVADITGMSSRTIRNYLKDGSLTGVKIGVQWRFTENEISKLFSRRLPGIKSPSQAVKAYLNDTESAENKGIVLVDRPAKSIALADKEFERIKSISESVTGINYLTYEFHDSPGILRISAEGSEDGISEFLNKLREGRS